MENYNKLVEAVKSTEKDANDFYNKGNKAAGTRLRKTLLDIRTLAQDSRNEVTAIKNTEKTVN